MWFIFHQIFYLYLKTISKMHKWQKKTATWILPPSKAQCGIWIDNYVTFCVFSIKQIDLKFYFRCRTIGAASHKICYLWAALNCFVSVCRFTPSICCISTLLNNSSCFPNIIEQLKIWKKITNFSQGFRIKLCSAYL